MELPSEQISNKHLAVRETLGVPTYTDNIKSKYNAFFQSYKYYYVFFALLNKKVFM